MSVGEFACERAGPVCRVPGLLGPLLVCTGVRRVADGQLVKNAGRVIFGLGEGGDRGRKTGAYLPGLPGKSLPGSRRVGLLAFVLRGRPGDRRLLPAAARGPALHGFVAALKAARRARQQRQRAFDGLHGIPVRTGHQATEFPNERLHLFVTLVGLTLAPVGEGVTLVGFTLPLVGLTLPLVGLTLSQVSDGFAHDSVTLALVGVASRLRLYLALFRSLRLRGLPRAGISLPGVIRTWAHIVTLPGTLAHYVGAEAGAGRATTGASSKILWSFSPAPIPF